MLDVTDNQNTAGTTAGENAIGVAEPTAATAMRPGQVLTVAQVGRELNVPRSWVYELITTGQLTAMRVGDHTPWWVHRADLEDFIAAAYRRTAENLHRLPMDPPAAFAANPRAGTDHTPTTRAPRRTRLHPGGGGGRAEQRVLSVVHTRAS